MAGFVPGLLALGVGLWACRFSIRWGNEQVAQWGRVFAVTLGVLALALVGLGLPWTGIGW